MAVHSTKLLFSSSDEAQHALLFFHERGMRARVEESEGQTTRGYYVVVNS